MARTAGAGLALCIGALCANDALGQSHRPAGRLGEMLFESGKARKSATPPVARYVAEGSVAFVLDRSSPLPLIRFDGSNEIWVLYPSNAGGNTIIYKNDVGENVLRVSPRLGGLTVFTATRPEGAAALLDGVSSSLRLPALPKEVDQAWARLKAATNRTSRAARRPIGVDVPDVDADSIGVAVDAALVAFEAFDRLAKSDSNARALARIGQVLGLEGDRPDVAVRQGSLVITVVPGRGVAGRPSSAKINNALQG